MIGLQDVNVLFGLRVGGLPVTGSSSYIWADILAEYLGVRPPPQALDGGKLKLTWIRETFSINPHQEVCSLNETVLHFHVRAYLLYLIGAVLFPDKSGNKVQLIFFPLLIDLSKLDDISWGSGVLAYLYRSMCNATKKGVTQIGGALLLLQFWSWERISIGRPRILSTNERVPLVGGVDYPEGMITQLIFGEDPLGCKWLRINRSFKDHRLGLVVYRELFDRMDEAQFCWMPYTPNVLQKLNPICYEDVSEWRVIAPLICFEVVEWHLPERCVRQFGWHQEVPPLCNTCVRLHGMGRRGIGLKDFAAMHAQWILQWTNRQNKLVQPGPLYRGFMDYNDEYLVWFRSITRRQISPPQASTSNDYADLHDFNPISTDYQSLVSVHTLNCIVYVWVT